MGGGLGGRLCRPSYYTPEPGSRPPRQCPQLLGVPLLPVLGRVHELRLRASSSGRSMAKPGPMLFCSADSQADTEQEPQGGCGRNNVTGETGIGMQPNQRSKRSGRVRGTAAIKPAILRRERRAGSGAGAGTGRPRAGLGRRGPTEGWQRRKASQDKRRRNRIYGEGKFRN